MAKFVQGEDTIINIQVTNCKNQKPYDFANFEGATAYFPTETDGEALAVTGYNSSVNILSFPMSTEQTGQVKAGESLDFEYHWQQDGNLYIERVEGQLTVLEQLF